MAGRARDILLRLTGDPSDARRALDDVTDDLTKFDRIQAEARADIEIAGAKAKLERLQDQLVRLSRQEATPAVQIKAASTVRQIEKIEADLKRLDGKKANVEITETTSRRGDGDGSTSGLGAGAVGGAAARVAGPVVAAGAITGLAGKAAIGEATDISEALSKNIVLFGEAAKAVERFSDTTAQKLGISKSAALEATGVFGNLLVALGIGPKRAADMSVGLTELASDLASFNNASPEEALDALRAGLSGETEPLRKFGVNINEAGLKAQALSMGLIKVVVDQDKLKSSTLRAGIALDKYNAAVAKYGKNSDEARRAQAGLLQAEATLAKVQEGKPEELTAQSKALAAQGLIFKQTEKAQGDFARTSDGLANKQRILKAEISDLGAEMGDKLLPAATTVVGGLVDLTQAAGAAGPALRDTVGDAIDAVGGFLEDNRDDLETTGQAFRNVGEVVRFVFEEVVLPIVRNTVETIRGVLDGFARAVRGTIRIITGVLTGDFGKAWEGVKDIFAGGIDAVVSVLDGAQKAFRGVGRRIGNAFKAGLAGAFEGVKSIGTTVVNALIDAVNAGIKTVNKVLGPRSLGPLGKTPDLRIGEIGKIGDDKPSGSAGQTRSGAPSRSPGGFRLPASVSSGLRAPAPGAPALAGAFSGSTITVPITVAGGGSPDPRILAEHLDRELSRRG